MSPTSLMLKIMASINNPGIIQLLVKLLIVLGLSILASANRRPHIIIFLADDMGWNDVGFHGMTDIPTPNIDALAADSLVLNNHYSSSVCTPSRASLLTGRYPSNIGIYEHLILNGEPWGLPLNIKLLPEFLNEIGYESHIVGKWHLGHHHRQYTPTYRGFQTHYGFYTGSIDYFNQEGMAFDYTAFKKAETEGFHDDDVPMVGKDMVDQLRQVPNRKKKYLTDLLTKRAKKVITKHDPTKPLFLFLSHLAVHRGNLARPMRAPDNETRHFLHFSDENKRNFAGALTALDSSLGTIFKALESKEMLEDTVLVFLSDNGAVPLEKTTNFGSNWPLRGQKGTPYEGGVRTVALIWGHRLGLKPKVKNGLFHISDWMPTLYRLAGGKVTALGHIDGIDLLDFLKLNKPSPRREVLVAIDVLRNVTAVRNDRYKLVKWKKARTERDWTAMDNRRNERKMDKRWRSSKVHAVLKRLYEKLGKGTGHMVRPLIEVNCNLNGRATKPLTGATMLFDLLEDPCELNNIGREQPKILDELLQRLNHWENKAPPPVSKKYLDVKSDPKRFNGYWSSWLDSDVFNHSTLYC